MTVTTPRMAATAIGTAITKYRVILKIALTLSYGELSGCGRVSVCTYTYDNNIH
jgi:hypothetical protein